MEPEKCVKGIRRVELDKQQPSGRQLRGHRSLSPHQKRILRVNEASTDQTKLIVRLTLD